MGIQERREREKENRRQDIIDAAERIFFAKGLDAATMDEIAEEAELSKGTLYLYFKSKEELYLQIHLRGNRLLTRFFKKAVKTKKSGIKKLRAIGEAYYSFYLEHPDYFSAVMYYESKDFDLSEYESCAQECAEAGGETLGVVIQAIQTGINDGSIRSDIDPLKTAVVLWGKSTGVINLVSAKANILKEHYQLEGKEIVTYGFDLIFESVKKR
jgi:TetR/AcrR family transcriptional regulator